jgi:hypothetical protein
MFFYATSYALLMIFFVRFTIKSYAKEVTGLFQKRRPLRVDRSLNALLNYSANIFGQ